MCRKTSTTITRRAPLVHAAHELAEEHVVGDVADRLVGAAGRVGAVVHRQEHAGHGLREEREHRRRAERVEPVGALRDLAEHQPARAARQRRALVDPVDDGLAGLGALLERRARPAVLRAGRAAAAAGRRGDRRGGSGSFGIRTRARARRVEVLADAVERLGRVARREAPQLAVDAVARPDLDDGRSRSAACRSGRAGAAAGRRRGRPGRS